LKSRGWGVGSGDWEDEGAGGAKGTGEAEEEY